MPVGTVDGDLVSIMGCDNAPSPARGASGIALAPSVMVRLSAILARRSRVRTHSNRRQLRRIIRREPQQEPGLPFLYTGVSGVAGFSLCSVCAQSSPGASHHLAVTPRLAFAMRMLLLVLGFLSNNVPTRQCSRGNARCSSDWPTLRRSPSVFRVGTGRSPRMGSVRSRKGGRYAVGWQPVLGKRATSGSGSGPHRERHPIQRIPHPQKVTPGPGGGAPGGRIRGIDP